MRRTSKRERLRARRILGRVAFLVAAAEVACHAPEPDCIDLGGCTGDQDAPVGSDAAAPEVAAPDGCDLAKPPREAPACVDDGVGVFVSPAGDDGATGSKTAPLKTIAQGVELARGRGLPRVYVCEGTYDKAVEITAAVSVYGGFSCTWTYTGAKPKLAPTSGIALRVTGASGAVLVEDMEVFGAADPAVPGDSAIAAFVSQATDVTLRNSTLTAGPGVDGAKGATATNWAGAADSGKGTTVATGATETACACADGATSSTGGRGGTVNGLVPTAGHSTPAVGDANAGLNGDANCSDGQPGANGLASGAGSSWPRPGALSASGWEIGTRPANASNGNPGQGGGGGGSKAAINIGGGGGGCGGCGGAGGAPGTSGGSSFALLSFNANVALEGARLVTGTAGRGGAGGDGQPGQAGGALGAGACNGGVGGDGAGGSGGGGGAGGHSVPVGFIGSAPRVSSTTLTPSTPGPGGSGGASGAGPGNAGATGDPGPEGKAEDTLSL